MIVVTKDGATVFIIVDFNMNRIEGLNQVNINYFTIFNDHPISDQVLLISY